MSGTYGSQENPLDIATELTYLQPRTSDPAVTQPAIWYRSDLDASVELEGTAQQFATLRYYDGSTTHDIPIVEPNTAEEDVYEPLKFQTGQGTGYVPISPDGAFGELRIQHAGDVMYLHDDIVASVIPDSDLTQISDHIWYMDEGEGQTLNDSEGSADGSLNHTDWNASDGVGTGDVFVIKDGVDNRADFGNIFDSQDAFTISIWTKPASQESSQLAHQGWDDSSNRTGLYVDSQGDASFAVFDTFASSRPAFSADQWQLWSLTFSTDGEANFYINDTNESTETGISGTFDSGDSFIIGDGGDGAWDGGVDYGVLAYQEATASDISDHYTQTKGLYGL